MRRDITRAVKKSFTAAIKHRCREFIELKNVALPAGARVFRWEAQPGLSFYLVLVTWSRQDKFTVECAWSKNGRFPSASRLSSPRDVPELGIVKDQPNGGDFRFRLAKLWLPRGDFWWEIVPSATPEEMIAKLDRVLQKTSEGHEPTLDTLRERIDASVADAVDRIVQHWLPYCRSMLV